MKFVMVPTENVRRFIGAAKALEGRLEDEEVQGMGLVYGRPGLGKTMAMDHYHARSRAEGLIRTVRLRALAIWTDASMLKGLLQGLGCPPERYRKDLMFDELVEKLTPMPAMFLIDEVDAIAESRRLISLLKDIHDLTGSAILMIGEERVDGLLKRYAAFYNRLNRAALVHLTEHAEDDVRSVIEQRCEYPVHPEVCREIHKTVGKSMRSVVDTIRDMERWARTNAWNQITMREYRKMMYGRSAKHQTFRTRDPQLDGAVNA